MTHNFEKKNWKHNFYKKTIHFSTVLYKTIIITDKLSPYLSLEKCVINKKYVQFLRNMYLYLKISNPLTILIHLSLVQIPSTFLSIASAALEVAKAWVCTVCSTHELAVLQPRNGQPSLPGSRDTVSSPRTLCSDICRREGVLGNREKSASSIRQVKGQEKVLIRDSFNLLNRE